MATREPERKESLAFFTLPRTQPQSNSNNGDRAEALTKEFPVSFFHLLHHDPDGLIRCQGTPVNLGNLRPYCTYVIAHFTDLFCHILLLRGYLPRCLIFPSDFYIVSTHLGAFLKFFQCFPESCNVQNLSRRESAARTTNSQTYAIVM